MLERMHSEVSSYEAELLMQKPVSYLQAIGKLSIVEVVWGCVCSVEKRNIRLVHIVTKQSSTCIMSWV